MRGKLDPRSVHQFGPQGLVIKISAHSNHGAHVRIEHPHRGCSEGIGEHNSIRWCIERMHLAGRVCNDDCALFFCISGVAKDVEHRVPEDE